MNTIIPFPGRKSRPVKHAAKQESNILRGVAKLLSDAGRHSEAAKWMELALVVLRGK